MTAHPMPLNDVDPIRKERASFGHLTTRSNSKNRAMDQFAWDSVALALDEPAELMRNSWSRIRASHARKYRLSKNLRRKCARRCYRDLTLLREESRPRQESSASARRQAGCQTTLSRTTLRFRKRHPRWWSLKEAETKTNLKVIFSRRDHGSNAKLANSALNQTSSRAHLTPAVDPLPVDVTGKAIKQESKEDVQEESGSADHGTAALPAASSSREQIHVDKSVAPHSTSSSYSSRFSARTVLSEDTTESNLPRGLISRTNTSGTATDSSGTYPKTDTAKDGYWIDAGRPHTCPGSVSAELLPQRSVYRLRSSRNSFASVSSGENSSRKSRSVQRIGHVPNRRTSLSMAGLKDQAVRKRTMLATRTGTPVADSSSTRSCLELSSMQTQLRIPSASPPRKRSNTANIVGEISAIRGNTELHRCLDSSGAPATVQENPQSSIVDLTAVEKTPVSEKALLLLFTNAEAGASTTQLCQDNTRAKSPARQKQLVASRSADEMNESAKISELPEIRASKQSLKSAEAESDLSTSLDAIESRSVMLGRSEGDSLLLEITKVLETQSSEEDKELQKAEAKNRSHLPKQFSPFGESSMKEQITAKGNRHRQRSPSGEDAEVTILEEVHPEVEILEVHDSRLRFFASRSGALCLDEDYHFLLSLYQQMTRIPRGKRLGVRMKIQSILYKELYPATVFKTS